MRLYDTITQSDLNNVIDKLLGNFHREISLDLDEPSNDYCSLEFDLSDGVDAGTEVIFNTGDELSISFSNPRLAELGYGLRFYYYQLDKGDYTRSKPYGELQSVIVDLDDDIVTLPFTENQIYLQKSFDLVLMNTGENLLLSVDKNVLFVGEDLSLTAAYSLDTLPVEGASVSFYNGETLLDTVSTDEDGEASLTVSDLAIGTYNFSCVCGDKYSKSILVNVVTENMMELEVVNCSSFSTYSSTPFTYNGKIFVDWGDDSGIVEYTGGKLTHNYESNDDYTITIYGDITSISDNFFGTMGGYGNNNVTSIIIPSSVTTLGEYCFTGCYNLTSAVIPDSVTIIGQYCFYSTGLTSINLPSTLLSIGNSCFASTRLTSIDIPSSVTSIGGYCFTGCTNLTGIKLKWNTSNEILTYNSSWITYTHSALKFHIPEGTTSLYTAKSYPSTKLVEDTI